MAAVVNDNSYADEQHADGFFADQFGAEAWTNATSPQRNRALVTARLLMDTHFDYIGQAAVAGQNLEWPRIPDETYYVGTGYGLDESILDGITIPNQIRLAQRELALHLLRNPDVLDKSTSYETLKSGNRQLGKVTLAPVFPPLVVKLLKPYVRSKSELSGVGNIL